MKSEVEKFLKGKALTTSRSKKKFYIFSISKANRVYAVTKHDLEVFVGGLLKAQREKK